MEPSKNFEEFCDRVCAQVQYVPARDAIRRELLGHMEDHAAVLQELGVPEEEAMQAAVAAMGDASEIGRELNEQHKPFWGRLLLGLRIALVLVFIFIFCVAASASNFGGNNPFWDNAHTSGWRQTLKQYPYQAIKLNTWQDFGGMKIHFKKAYLVSLGEDGRGAYELYISATLYQKNWLQQVESPFHANDTYVLVPAAMATDDVGNTYYSRTPFYIYYIDPKANEIFIDYERFGDRLTVVIPLQQAWEGLR